MTEDSLQLVGFANPVGLLPAFLLPVFASTLQSNAYYLQRVDDKGHIAEFEEADLTDELIATPQMLTASVGDAALYAFGTGHGDPVLFGIRNELAPLLVERRNTYLNLPVLYLAIVEFCDLDEVKNANRRAYRHLVQQAGIPAARSWRDSQIILPIIRALLANAADESSPDDTRPQRVSVFSTKPGRLRVQAQGYDPNAVSNVLRSRQMRQALARTGLAEKVSVVLEAPPEPKPAAAKPVPALPAERLRTTQRSSVEMAMEELVDRGLSSELQRWLEDFVRKDFRSKSDDFSNYVLEWCDRQPISRASLAYARLLCLESIPIIVFRMVSEWLEAHQLDEDVGPLYPPAISLLRARDALYLTRSRSIARGAIVSPKQATPRTPKPLVSDALRESEIPIWSLHWVEENRRSRWTPQILQALIELPFDLPPVLELTNGWLKRDGRSPETGRLLIALLRSKGREINLENVVRDVARWIDENGRHQDAPRLLTAMLTRTQPAKNTEPFDIAAHWAERRGPQANVLSVLSALLRIAPRDKRVTRLALKIADTRTDLRTAANSLVVLLNDPDLRDEARWRAEHWLEEHAHHPAALAVFEAYFRCDVLPRRKPVYVRLARTLAQEFPKRAGVGPLFAQLLARFPDDDAILDEALDWLTAFDAPGARGRPVVLTLLGRRSRKRRTRIRSVVRRWLASHRDDSSVARALGAF